MATAEEEPVRIYRAPEHSVEERCAVATQFLSCAVCQKSLQYLETAVSCERCEIRRYCSEEHRSDPRDRDHACVAVPPAFKGTGASVARNLDMLTLALLVMNKRNRADGRTPVKPEPLRGVAQDLLASFFDVAYRGVVLVPMMNASVVEQPEVQAQLAPDYGQAMFDNLMLRKAVHLVLDNTSTEEEREAEALREQEHPTAYYLRQAMRAYMPVLVNVMRRLPYEEHPNDPVARKVARRSIALTIRRFVVALTNVKRDEQLGDVGTYLAGLERKYGTLFAPWKRAEGDSGKSLPTVEEIVVDDSDEEEGEDVFSDLREPSSSSDEDEEEHFVDAEEFKARFMNMFGGKETGKETERKRSGSVGARTEEVDAQRLFNRAHCLGLAIPLTYVGAILMTGFIDMFFSVVKVEQHHLVMKKNALAVTDVSLDLALKKGGVAFVAPLEIKNAAKIDVKTPISKTQELVFKNVGISDPAFLYAKTLNGVHPTIDYTDDAHDNPWYWWHRWVQPLRMINPALKGDTPPVVMNNIAPGFFMTAASVSTVVAVLQQTSTLQSVAVFDAVLLLTAVRCIEVWSSFAYQMLAKLLWDRGGDDEMALVAAAEKLWKAIEEKLRQVTKRNTDAEGNTTHDMEKYNLVRDAVTPEKLVAFYKKTVAKEDLSMDLAKMTKVMKKIGLEKWDKKKKLFAKLKKYRDRFLSGTGSWNATFANFETSGWSMAATTAHQLQLALHPPKDITEKYSGFWPDMHTAMLVKDLLVVPALVWGVNLSMGNNWTMQNLLHADTSIWMMAIAPILASSTPVAALNALAVVSALSTGFSWASRLFDSAPFNFQSAATMWMTGLASYNETFMRLFYFSASISLLKSRLVKKLIGWGASRMFGSRGEMIHQHWLSFLNFFGLGKKGVITRLKQWVIEKLAEWLHLPVDVSANFFNGFWKVVARIGLGYAASYIVNHVLGTGAYGQTDYIINTSHFINFSFILAALAGNYEMMLVNVVMTFAFRTARFYGDRGLRVQSPWAPPSLEAAPRRKEKVSLPALENGTGDPWTSMAADAVKANREFENIVCALFRDDAEHFRELFEELRLASSALMNQLVEYMISGDDHLLPRTDDFGLNPPPIAFSRFTAALRALFTALGQPLQGRRHFKTDADHPDKAVPISFAEQIGADQIRKIRHALTQLYYEMDGDDDDDPNFHAHFDGKIQRERRWRHGDPAIPTYDDEPKYQRAEQKATRLTRFWDNTGAFGAYILSTLAMVTRAAQAGYGYVFKNVRPRNQGPGFTMTIPDLPSGQPSAFTKALADLEDANAELYFKDGRSLYARITAFFNKLENDRIVADGTRVTRENLLAYLDKQSFSNAALKELTTLRDDSVSEANSIISKVNGDVNTVAGYFIEVVNKVADFITGHTEPVETQTTTPNPPAPPPPLKRTSPSPTISNSSSPSSSGSAFANSMYEKWKSMNLKSLPEAEQISSFAKTYIAAYVPELVSNNPFMATHVLLHSAVEYSDIGRYPKEERMYRVAARVRPDWRWARSFLLNAGPLVLDLALQSVYQTSFLSNNERYYFALQAGVDIVTKIRAWWFWRKNARDAHLKLLQGESTEAVEVYQLLQLQRALPLASLMTMRDLDPTTVDLVSLLQTKGVALLGISLASAHMVHTFHKRHVVPAPYYQPHWAQPLAYSLPAIVLLTEAPWRQAMVALVSYAMSVHADEHIRTSYLRLGLAALVAHETCIRGERLPGVIAAMARGYLDQAMVYLRTTTTPLPHPRPLRNPTFPLRPEVSVPTATPPPPPRPQSLLVLAPNLTMPVDTSDASIWTTHSRRDKPSMFTPLEQGGRYLATQFVSLIRGSEEQFVEAVEMLALPPPTMNDPRLKKD